MSSVFRKSQNVNNDVKKNTFDYSFTNNLTTKLGQITPCFFADMLPGSSLRINPKQAWNFMPMLYPVQTPVRSYVHFFKVRKRTLWDGFMDYFGKTPKSKTLVKPYIDVDNQLVFNNSLKTGSLGDYLGLPTTVVGTYGSSSSYSSVQKQFAVSYPYSSSDPSYFTKSPLQSVYNHILIPTKDELADGSSTRSLMTDAYLSLVYDITSISSYFDDTFWQGFSLDLDDFSSGAYSSSLKDGYVFSFYKLKDGVYSLVDQSHGSFDFLDVVLTPSSFYVTFKELNSHSSYFSELIRNNSADADGFYFSFTFGFKDVDSEFFYNDSGKTYYTSSPVNRSTGELVTSPYTVAVTDSSSSVVTVQYNKGYSFPKLSIGDGGSVPLVKPVEFGNNAYFGSSASVDSDKIKIDAMPFRAYEAVYNSFYRNILNNPYKLNGVEEYNQFIPTLSGGIDSNVYSLHQRNWDDDFLTTAIQNPQQGEFPVVVGMTNLGSGMALAMRDEDGNNYHLQAVLSSDGKSITSFKVTDLPDSAVISTPSAYIDMADSGISIPDLRCANALQRWLELNARKGLRFKDLVKGRFDTDIRFDELNMPEFIGGFSSSLNMTAVDQTYSTNRVGSFDEVLGSFSGQGYISGYSEHPITVFCDEPCYIIGLVSIVPTACYSQLLPKHFINRDILDEFSPEFNHIGYQPITYREVCPNQAYLDGVDKLNTVFGYQRAWYDYIARTDEVHGDFRTTLRDFLINRVFNAKPELSPSFLLVDGKQVNDVFSVTDDSDKILGQIYFDCSIIHPISKYGTARLEA